MTELRCQVNVRLTSEMNVSIALTAIVETTEEAEAFGTQHAQVVARYLHGFATEVSEETE